MRSRGSHWWIRTYAERLDVGVDLDAVYKMRSPGRLGTAKARAIKMGSCDVGCLAEIMWGWGCVFLVNPTAQTA